MALDIADQPPLSALYEELHSALITVGALHRLIAAHPAAGPRATHRLAAAYTETELQRFGYRPPEEPPHVQ